MSKATKARLVPHNTILWFKKSEPPRTSEENKRRKKESEGEEKLEEDDEGKGKKAETKRWYRNRIHNRNLLSKVIN